MIEVRSEQTFTIKSSGVNSVKTKNISESSRYYHGFETEYFPWQKLISLFGIICRAEIRTEVEQVNKYFILFFKFGFLITYIFSNCYTKNHKQQRLRDDKFNCKIFSPTIILSEINVRYDFSHIHHQQRLLQTKTKMLNLQIKQGIF